MTSSIEGTLQTIREFSSVAPYPLNFAVRLSRFSGTVKFFRVAMVGFVQSGLSENLQSKHEVP